MDTSESNTYFLDDMYPIITDNNQLTIDDINYLSLIHISEPTRP